jgi:DNA invertase Pin-like site-specific DNA recombinase
MRYGYARVSTNKQDYTLQVDALMGAGCELIFTEKVTAKSTDGRKEFKRLMRAVKPGDTVVVTRLDRLARSSRDLHNVIHDLREADCNFLSLRETWCNTTTAHGKLMLTIMGGIAEFERELIRVRCEEGIAKARERGKKFGRPAALDAGQRRRIAERHAEGDTMAELAREYECGEATIWRALRAA